MQSTKEAEKPLSACITEPIITISEQSSDLAITERSSVIVTMLELCPSLTIVPEIGTIVKKTRTRKPTPPKTIPEVVLESCISPTEPCTGPVDITVTEDILEVDSFLTSKTILKDAAVTSDLPVLAKPEDTSPLVILKYDENTSTDTSSFTNTTFNRKYTRATWFEKEIAFHLLAEGSYSGRHNGLLRASSIGSKCSRRLGYMVLGYRKGPETAHQQYVLNMGNAVHDMIQMWMAKMGLVKARPVINSRGQIDWEGDAEGTIKDDSTGIHGHYDGLSQPLVFKNPDDSLPLLQNPKSLHYCSIDKTGKRYLLEFKTIANRSKVIAIFLKTTGKGRYKKQVTVKHVIEPGQSLYSDLATLPGSKLKPLTEKGNEKYLEIVTTEKLQDGALLDIIHQPGAFQQLARPKDEHVMQSTYYAHQLKADKVMVIYLAKDSGDKEYSTDSSLNLPIKAYEFDIDPAIVLKVNAKARNLWDVLEKNSVKNPDPKKAENWLPDREFHPDDFMSECKYCSYSYHCYPYNTTVREQLTTRMKEYRGMQLPVLNMKPFQDHSDKEWGRHNSTSVKDV